MEDNQRDSGIYSGSHYAGNGLTARAYVGKRVGDGFDEFKQALGAYMEDQRWMLRWECGS